MDWRLPPYTFRRPKAIKSQDNASIPSTHPSKDEAVTKLRNSSFETATCCASSGLRSQYVTKFLSFVTASGHEECGTHFLEIASKETKTTAKGAPPVPTLT